MELSIVERIVFWSVLLVGLIFFVLRVIFLYKALMKGQKDITISTVGARLTSTSKEVLLQLCNFSTVMPGDRGGIGHAFIFWGFLCFVVNYVLFVFLGDGLGLPLRNFTYAHYTLYVVDIAGVTVLLAILWAAYRRYIAKENRLERSLEAGVILIAIFCLIGSHFVIEAIRINTDIEPFKTPLASLFAVMLNSQMSINLQKSLLHPIWWGHYLLLIGFMVFVPYSKHLHIISSVFNLFFKRSRPSGELRYINVEQADGFGAFEVEGFTRKQLLDTYSCTHCGRCDVNCPAFLSGKSLSPSKILDDVKQDLFKYNSGKPIPDSIKFPVRYLEAVNSCTTCGACVEVCPVYNRPMELITEIRRGLVYEGVIDEKHQEALQRTSNYGNPNAVIPKSKDSLLNILGLEKAVADKKYDVLYWLGCSTYFDERTQDIVKNVLQIIKKSGLSVAALGSRENCCGDFVRRLGDEGMFQQLAKENIKAIAEINYEILLTHCAHGYNSFKNEYPQLGVNLNVIHYTEFIANQIMKNNLAINKTDTKVLYHDPCYLGRHNGIYDLPRDLLSSVSQGVDEFEKSKNKSLCCGAGGGHMWKHETEGTKMTDARIDQALSSEVKTIATACPYCLAMFEDSLVVKGLADEIQVMDISEIVARAIC